MLGEDVRGMKAYVASHLKEMNRQKVYQLICNMNMTSKAEIAKITGISSPTVIKIVNFLTNKNLITEIGEVETAIGRRPHMLKLNAECMYAATFVLEGDYLSMGIVNIANQIVYKKIMQVAVDYEQLMAFIRNQYVEELIKESGIERGKLFGIGIALPVIYDKARGRISGAPLIQSGEWVYIQDDIRLLEEKYHAVIMIENDTNAQTLGEFHKCGYNADEDLIFISAGTGLGAGIILNGKLRRGTNAMCGEIGFMTLEENYKNDRKNFGWMEERIGYRKLREKFGLEIVQNQKEILSSLKEQIIPYVAKPLSVAIHNMNVCLDCANIVLGGTVAERLWESLIEEINRCLEQLSINEIKIRKESSEDVGLVGIGWLLTAKKIKEILKSDIDE